MARHLTRPEQALEMARAALETANGTGDAFAAAWAQLTLALTGYRLIGADLVALELSFAEATSKMQALDDARGQRLCALAPAVMASKRGNWVEALARYEDLLGSFDLDALDEDNFYAFIGLSTSHVYCGNLAEGLRFGYAGVQHAQQLGLTAQEVVMCLPLGVALMAARDVEESAMLFGTAERLCEKIDSPTLLKTVRINRAIALRRLHRFAEAKRLVQLVLDEPAPLIGGQPFAHYTAAELNVQLGDLDEAEKHLKAAQELNSGPGVSLLDQAKTAYIAGLLASRKGDDEVAMHELGRVVEMLPRVSAWRFSDRNAVYDELAAVYARKARYHDAYVTQRRSSDEYRYNVDVLNHVRHFSMQLRTEMNRVQAELRRTSQERLNLQSEQRQLRDEIERTATEAANLKEAAATDKLTGLPNRRYLDEVLPALLKLRQQTATPMAIAFIDLDHFKDVNDRYGHSMGDQVLRGFGEIAMHATRNADVMGRYGGEEFCIAMSGCGPEAAAKRLRALLMVFANRHFVVGSQNLVGITFSAGVAVYPEDGVELESLMATADRRLYEAKRAGRARVQERDFQLVTAAAKTR
ncbi:MAG: diguanylate cyclase [Betaproteobacteria bacterium]